MNEFRLGLLAQQALILMNYVNQPDVTLGNDLPIDLLVEKKYGGIRQPCSLALWKRQPAINGMYGVIMLIQII